jgi:hypothetical protein
MKQDRYEIVPVGGNYVKGFKNRRGLIRREGVKEMLTQHNFFLTIILAGQERELKERLLPFFPIGHRRLLHGSVAPRVAVTAEPVEDLEGHEGRSILVPLGDQSLVGSDERRQPRLDHLLVTNDPRHGPSAHRELLRDLTHRQALDFPESANLDPACLFHGPKDTANPRRFPSRLVSSPRSSGCKCIIIYAPQEDLVLYHLPPDAARYEKNHFIHRLFGGDLVLYHRPNLFSSSSPLLDVRISAAEIAGIMFRPAALGQGLERLPTGLPQAGLLPGAYSGMGAKVSPAKLAALKHPSPTP